MIINQRSMSLMPKVEAKQTSLRAGLDEALKTFDDQAAFLHKFRDLIAQNVSEQDIDPCIKAGSDPHSLGRQKSLYKCMFQFASRARLVSFVLGQRDVLSYALQPMETPPAASDVRDGLRKMVQQLGLT